MSRVSAFRGGAADVIAVAVLGVLALLGFRNTYAGWWFLVVGAAGLAVGAAIALVLHRLRQPALMLGAALLVAYFAGGLPLVLTDQPWLSLASGRTIAVAAILGWKELLTTLPPVEATGVLLVVPYILGLLCGAIGVALARGTDRPSRPGSGVELLRTTAPALAPLATLAAVMAFGTNEPAADLLDGVGFAVICLVWVAARLRRRRPPVHGARRPVRRALIGGAVLVAAAAAAVFVAPVLPGAANSRTVLRDEIVPPLDLSAYPSPLVGFRKYTKDAKKLWDQKLFTVTGLPEGDTVRIATLNDYDGSVWGVTDAEGFRRVGASLTPTSGRSVGPLATIRVTIEPAYAAASDVSVWLPQAGVVSNVEFQGTRSRDLAASLHYNQALETGIVTARLKPGDSYTMTVALAAPTLPQDVQPAGRPDLTETAQALLSSKVAAWVTGGADLGGRLAEVAKHLRETGAYSDGGPGETQFLPGHGTGRLGSFLQGEQPVGDDEQYAAAYALVANHLGIPARVVLGARPDAQGVVRGSAVHAWVELHVADRGWVPVPETEFMPDPSKRPNQQPPQRVEEADAAVVPPPNAIRLPSTPTDTSRVDPQYPPQEEVPWWRRVLNALLPYLTWGAPPVALMAFVVGGILWVKARRRRRRRTIGSPAKRFGGAWRELVDGARDTGVTVPSGLTLQDQAGHLERTELLPRESFTKLADRVEEVVFGPDDPTAQDAADFWKAVDETRADLVRQWSRRPARLWMRIVRLAWARRAVAALNLRSLRPATPGPVLPLGGESR